MSSIVQENPIFEATECQSIVDQSIEGHANKGRAIDSHAGAGFFCQQLKARGLDGSEQPRILIAGCGAGHEAVAIQQCLDAWVDAVDVEDFVEPQLSHASHVRFQVASVCDLPFANATFDAIFYHHVIEHVDAPRTSIDELARVIRPEGWLFVGTPNRHRLISSIGAHRQSEWEASLMNKLFDNVRDWKDRLIGRFRNEFGAHAGFSRRELDEMLSERFQTRYWLTEQYLRFKYSEWGGSTLFPIATHPAICWFSAPSIYVLCRKTA